MNFLSKLLVFFAAVFVLFVMVDSSREKLTQNNFEYHASTIQFSGEDALSDLGEFVELFPNRDSGQPNNIKALNWLEEKYTELGLTCDYQYWNIVNYSKPVGLNNLVCVLEGEDPRQIVITAHHDQAPMTVQGADNDASGISVQLELARIFSDEGSNYTLVFLTSDGEEYGMLGSKHYVENHPDPNLIIAGFSVDNVGKKIYTGMDMSPIGQFMGYGDLWLQRFIRDVSASNNLSVQPKIRPTIAQAIDQAVPISFMDQGPLVASGIPAVGFAATYPPEASEIHWDSYHTSGDIFALQSARSLESAGKIVESTIRQMQKVENFPKERGPYLFFESSETVLRGPSLYLAFAAFVSVFFLASLWVVGFDLDKAFVSWKKSVIHFFGKWGPLLLGIIALNIFPSVGLIPEFHLYPATAKDPVLFSPNYLAYVVFISVMVVFYSLSRKVARRYSNGVPSFLERKCLAMLVIGMACFYTMFSNPFSLLIVVPSLLWLLINDRKGKWKVVDITLFVLGGLFIYFGLYYFGWIVLRNQFAILWYVMMMISIPMASYKAMLAITTVIAAGLTLIVTPPKFK